MKASARDAVRLIQDRGWNVRYVGDVGLLGRSDEEDFGIRLGRAAHSVDP